MTFFLPEAALDQHVAVLGKTGSGKTWTAKLIVENVLRRKRQVCVLDPTGAWFGLRLAADGRGKGLDVVLLGGDHADIPLAERSGGAVARLVTEQGASIVIDTSGLTVGEYTRWFIDFAGTLYTTLRNPLHLVIDEAHYFMPQGRVPDPDAGRMLHAGNRLMSGGRSRGVRGLLITQRPAKLHKDALTCADTLIAMRVIAPQDRNAVKDWIDGCGNAADGRTVLDSLATLKRGEGWVWYPEGSHLKRETFPPILTYDSSAAPKYGAKAAPQLTEIDLSEVRKALADAVQEAEANDPKLLRRRIADLERKLKDRPAETIEVERVVEVPVLKNGQLDRTEKIAERVGGFVDRLAGEVAELRRLIGPAAGPRVIPKPAPVIPNAAAAITRPAKSMPERPAPIPGGGGTTGPEQRILDALAWLESIGVGEPEQPAVAFLAGYTVGGGAWNNPRGRLHSRGLIQYRAGNRLSLTDAGRALANAPDAPLTADELQRRVMERLPGPERRVLRVLLDAYPGDVGMEDLAVRSGYAEGGGAFNNPRGRLRTLGLIHYPAKGRAAALPLLFPEA